MGSAEKICFPVNQGKNIYFYPQQSFEKAKRKAKGGGSEYWFRREAGQEFPLDSQNTWVIL